MMTRGTKRLAESASSAPDSNDSAVRARRAFVCFFFVVFLFSFTDSACFSSSSLSLCSAVVSQLHEDEWFLMSSNGEPVFHLLFFVSRESKVLGGCFRDGCLVELLRRVRRMSDRIFQRKINAYLMGFVPIWIGNLRSLVKGDMLNITSIKSSNLLLN